MPVAVHVVERADFGADVPLNVSSRVGVRAWAQRNVIERFRVLLFVLAPREIWIFLLCHVKCS